MGCTVLRLIGIKANGAVPVQTGDWRAEMCPRLRPDMRLPAAIITFLLAVPATIAGAEELRGKALVETNCARCHAIGTNDASTHPDAPPFRTLSKRYPIEDLEEALAEGISTGHPDMPEFVASPDQIDAIIAYIRSVQDR